MVAFFGDKNRTFFSNGNLYFLALCFFVVTLYSPVSQVNNLAIALIGLTWVFAGNYKKISSLLSNPAALCILLFYLFQACTLFYTQNKPNGSKWLEYRSPFFYLPLLLGTSEITAFQKRKLLKFFAWVTVAVVTIGLGYGIIRSLMTGDSVYLYSDSLGFLFDKQAVYLAMYVNFAIVIFLYFLHQHAFEKKIHRRLAVGSICLMAFVNYLLASRNAMLVLVCVLSLYVFYLIYKRKQYLTGLILIFGLLTAVILSVKMFPKAAGRIVDVTNSSYQFNNLHEFDHFNGEVSAANWNSLNTRLAVWHCAGEVIKKHLIAGVGIGDVEDNLLAEYRSKDFVFGVRYNLNCHDQYLDALVGYGIVGFLVFVVCIFGVPLLSAWKTRNYPMLYFICSLGIYFVTEVMFNRNQGVTFIAFFMIILAARPTPADAAACQPTRC